MRPRWLAEDLPQALLAQLRGDVVLVYPDRACTQWITGVVALGASKCDSDVVAYMAIILALMLQGCGIVWETTLDRGGRLPGCREPPGVEGIDGRRGKVLPVDAVLYSAGYELVASVTVTGTDGVATMLDWAEVADDAYGTPMAR